jgi:hypothetical protein
VHRQDVDHVESRVASELGEAVGGVAAVVAGRGVIRLHERHGDDEIAAVAHDARELADAALRVDDVLEHRVAERGVERRVGERHRLDRSDDDVRLARRDVVTRHFRHAVLA